MCAIELLRRAVDFDPQFALAWVALSRAGQVHGGFGNTKRDFDEGYRLAGEAAERALALVPDLAEGHVALGPVQCTSDFDSKGSAASMARAQQLAPNDPAMLAGAIMLAGAFGDTARANLL